jgi:hypothetical protein
MVRFADWRQAGIAGEARRLVEAIRGAALPAPLILALCPPEDAEAERIVREGVADLPAVHTIGPAEVATLYPVAEVHDPHADEQGFRNIELRGDLIWSGASDAANAAIPHATGVTLADGGACINGMDNEVPVFGPPPPVAAEYGIWDGIAVGGDAQTFWSLDQSSSTTQGNYSSLDSSTHLGVEFEVQVGLGVKAIVGASYEFTMGTTKETQNSISWGSGLGISGEVGGFVDPLPGVVTACKYKPRPYAYRRQEFSDAGSLQDMYVTDYVVRQGQLGGVWQRGNVAETCYTGEGMVDRIFDDGFDAGID